MCIIGENGALVICWQFCGYRTFFIDFWTYSSSSNCFLILLLKRPNQYYQFVRFFYSLNIWVLMFFSWRILFGLHNWFLIMEYHNSSTRDNFHVIRGKRWRWFWLGTHWRLLLLSRVRYIHGGGGIWTSNCKLLLNKRKKAGLENFIVRSCVCV